MPGATGASCGDAFDRLPNWRSAAAEVAAQTRATLAAIDPQGGDYHAELDSDGDFARCPDGSNSSMIQDAALDPGGYALSVWRGSRDATPKNNGMRARVGVAGDLDLLFDGLVNLGGVATRLSVDPSPTIVGARWLVTGPVSAPPAGIYAVRFSATGPGDELGGFVDDVSLTAAPLPAPGFLPIGALAGLGVPQRRTAAA